MGPRNLLDSDALVFLFIGASAVGKSSLAIELCAAGLVEGQPTWATRKPRPDETVSSCDHRFVSSEQFDIQSRKGGFLAEEPLYKGRYGVPFLHEPAPGLDVLMVLKPVFIPKFKAHYPNTRIYQIEASPEVLPQRMRMRGQSEEEIATRMEVYEHETAAARRFADVIFSNDGPFEEAYNQVSAQICLDREAYLSAKAIEL